MMLISAKEIKLLGRNILLSTNCLSSEFHGIQNAQSLALFDHPGIWHVDSVTILGGDA